MKKKIHYFPQHILRAWEPTMETCGAACVLMLLDYYEIITTHPTRKMEVAVYTHHKVFDGKGMTGAAVANCLSNPAVALEKFLRDPNKQLDVHLVQSFEEKLDNRDDYLSWGDYEKITENHLSQLSKCKDRIRLTAGLDFDTEFLKQALAAGKKIILEFFVPEVEDAPPSVLHWVILENYDPQLEAFRVRDPNPNIKLKYLKDAELEGYMDTPIGRICIIVGEKD